MSISEQLEGNEVRLFPSAHISSSREAELRAAASLLSVVLAVSEFGRIVIRAAGGPVGRITCYTEVPFKVGAPPGVRTIRPDGIIRAVRGKRDWSALVEAKVGDNPLDQAQVDAYHKLAGDEGFDALITISNQASLPNGLPPVAIDRRRLRRVPVVHLSWERLLADAKMLCTQKQVEDADHAWMLDQWIKYVADPDSRIIEPPSLGKHWNPVLNAARENKLTSVSNQLLDVVERWDGFLRKLALGLRAKMGVEVERYASRSDVKDPSGRLKRMHGDALDEGVLRGSLVVPDAIGDIDIEVMLHGRTVRYSVEFKAPTEGRLKTRINWLLRQLRVEEAPNGLKVRVDWDKRRLHSEADISKLQEDYSLLMVNPVGQSIPGDAMPRRYRLSWATPLPKGRGRAGGYVLVGISAGIERFYRQVVERMVPFVPKAPRLPSEAPEIEEADTAGPEATATQPPVTSGVEPAAPAAPTMAPRTNTLGGSVPSGSGIAND